MIVSIKFVRVVKTYFKTLTVLTKKKLNSIRKKLSTTKNDIRTFSSPTSSLLRKRKILASEQTGAGIFSLLATTIIPALISAVAK